MNRALNGASFAIALLLAACGGRTEPTNSPGAEAAAPVDDHGPARPLGELTVGSHRLRVVRYGDVVAGKDTPFDLVLADEAVVPDAVRAWIGLESAVGSRKTRLSKEGKATLHGHVDAPKVLPPGARFWVEVEHDGARTTASLALD